MEAPFEHQRLSREKFLRAAGLAGAGFIFAGGIPQVAGARPSGARRAAAGPSLARKTVMSTTPLDVEVLREFFNTQRKQAALPGNGERIIFVDANLDTVKQHTQVDQMIDQGADAIVLFVLTVPGWEATATPRDAFGLQEPLPACDTRIPVDRRREPVGPPRERSCRSHRAHS